MTNADQLSPDLYWFIPSGGDGRRLGQPSRPASFQYLSQVAQAADVLGFDGVRPKASATVAGNSGPVAGTGGAAASSTPERFVLEQVGVEAHALEVGGEFTVLKGSTVRSQGQAGWTSYKTLRERLVEEKKIGPHTTPNLLVFLEDVAFRSTSAAAAVILGRNANGRTSWKHESSGQLYREWQDLGLPLVGGLIRPLRP